MNQPTYHFDVLPLHPHPRPLESFTSYLMRLAELNGMGRYSDLAYRLFPDRTPLQVRAITDHIPVLMSQLARETVCSEATLQATTFYYFGQKFGRYGYLQNFLKGILVPHLRYCPHCLDEQLYYLLPWRILALSGCHKHNCQLLDSCSTCGKSIPIFPNTLRVGICPHCRTALKTCVTASLPPDAQQQAYEIYHDLVFLFSPQSWELVRQEMAVAAGCEFERLRWQTGLTPAAASQKAGTSSSYIRHIERGTIGGTFQHYVQYASFLEISLRQVFLDGVADYEPLPDTPLTHEMMLAIRLEKALDRMREKGQLVNDTTLRKTTGVSRDTLRSYATTRAMLEAAQTQAYQQREGELLGRIKDIVAQHHAQGKPIYRTDIYRILQMSQNGVNAYPRIRAYLKQLNAPSGHCKPGRMGQDEQDRLAQVEQAIQYLLDSGQTINQRAVAKQVGLCCHHLRQYPQVKRLLQQTATIRFEQHQTRFLEQVQEAIFHLEQSGQPITQKAVTTLTGISHDTLSKYPKLRELFVQYRTTQTRQRNDDWINRILQAINFLKQNNLSITQKAICRTAGVREGLSREHPDIQAIIQPVLAEEEQRREQYLMTQVSEAIHQLKSYKQPITIPAVGEIIGLSASRLRWYPEVTTLIREAREATRQQYEDQLIQDIYEAVQHLHLVGSPLTQKRICEEIGMAVMNLPNYHRAKELVSQIAKQYHQENETSWHYRYQS